MILLGSITSSIRRIAATGGSPQPATTLAPGELGHVFPQFLPDGRHFLYLALRSEDSSVFLGSLDSKPPVQLTGSTMAAVYSSGYLLFVRQGILMAQAFDPSRLQLTGEPVPVPATGRYPFRRGGEQVVSASENGVLALLPFESGSAELAWFDRAGKRLGAAGSSFAYSHPALSPDQKRVVVERPDPKGVLKDLWLIDLRRDTGSRFTFDPGDDGFPLWAPDGSRVAFASYRGGSWKMSKPSPTRPAASGRYRLPGGAAALASRR